MGSAASPSIQVATSLAPVTMVLMLLLGGFYVNTDNIPSGVSVLAQTLRQVCVLEESKYVLNLPGAPSHQRQNRLRGCNSQIWVLFTCAVCEVLGAPLQSTSLIVVLWLCW